MRRSPGTGSVEERVWPSGRVTWRARWYDAGGNRQRASFDTRREAEVFLADRLAEVRHGGLGTMEGRRTTLAEWWAEWQLGRQVGLLTARREESAWECWVGPHLGSVKLADLRRSTLQAWVAGQGRGGVAPSTIERHVGILRACLSAAVTEGLISSNPASKLTLPRGPKAEQRFLSVDEVRRLCQAVEPRFASMLAVGIACGLRIGELCALGVCDLDLLRRTVTVRRTVLADTGFVGPVKSRSGEGRDGPVAFGTGRPVEAGAGPASPERACVADQEGTALLTSPLAARRVAPGCRKGRHHPGPNAAFHAPHCRRSMATCRRQPVRSEPLGRARLELDDRANLRPPLGPGRQGERSSLEDVLRYRTSPTTSA